MLVPREIAEKMCPGKSVVFRTPQSNSTNINGFTKSTPVTIDSKAHQVRGTQERRRLAGGRTVQLYGKGEFFTDLNNEAVGDRSMYLAVAEKVVNRHTHAAPPGLTSGPKSLAATRSCRSAMTTPGSRREESSVRVSYGRARPVLWRLTNVNNAWLIKCACP